MKDKTIHLIILLLKPCLLTEMLSTFVKALYFKTHTEEMTYSVQLLVAYKIPLEIFYVYFKIFIATTYQILWYKPHLKVMWYMLKIPSDEIWYNFQYHLVIWIYNDTSLFFFKLKEFIFLILKMLLLKKMALVKIDLKVSLNLAIYRISNYFT